MNVALHAHVLLHRDVDYIVRDGKVHLINDTRGRVAQLQRWPDGLQAAVEAKENVEATESGEILDSITVQALLSRYPTRCGMTGTAVAVAETLREFYKLEVLVIPPNKENVREDEHFRLYATLEQKEDGDRRGDRVRARDRAPDPRRHAGRRRVRADLSSKLRAAGLECVVLNAKNDAEEASIIADAGSYQRITVSTQMAGRGTDIRLGGHDGEDHDRIVELGGLYVIGSGTHSSTRLDDQLRGRAGRQGDPGGSVFFVVHAGRPGHPVRAGRRGSVRSGQRRPDAPTRALLHTFEHAQRVAEGVNLEIHRNTWRYNKLIEHQRDLLLEHRDEVLRTDAAFEKVGEKEGAEPATTSRAPTPPARSRCSSSTTCWTHHLTFLTDLREGIHLRALARQNPLDEFHREAIPAFNKIVPESLGAHEGEVRGGQDHRRRLRPRRRRRQAPELDVDLPRARQPVRLRARGDDQGSREDGARPAPLTVRSSPGRRDRPRVWRAGATPRPVWLFWAWSSRR